MFVFVALAAAAPPDLTGTWVQSDDPTPGPHRVVLECLGSPTLVRLRSTADQVRLDWRFGSTRSGGVDRGCSDARTEWAEGSWKGDSLRLVGRHEPRPGVVGCEPVADLRVRYDLALDGASGALVGTRNGQPFRIAPAELAPSRVGCGPPPPGSGVRPPPTRVDQQLERQ